MTTKELIDKRLTSLERFEGGSLCVWGVWFGRPMDNVHYLTSALHEPLNNALILVFSNNERLTILNPGNITETKTLFEVNDADEVLWEWYYGGKPQVKENLFFEEYKRTGTTIEFRTNVNIHKSKSFNVPQNKGAVFMA